MSLLMEGWIALLYFEYLLRFRDFSDVYRSVRKCRTLPVSPENRVASAKVVQAFELVCAFYVKPVLCLQRSAAVTLLLRRRGWCAEMVVGAQTLPFRSHAWVELDGQVVNDKPYMPELYQILDRC